MVKGIQAKHIKLGRLLMEKGAIQEWQFLLAMGARRPGQKLGEVMVERRFLSEELLLEALSQQLGLPLVRLAGMTVTPQVIQAVPGHVARRFCVFPLALEAGIGGELPTLRVAMADPTDIRVVDALRFLLDLEIRPVLAGRRDIIRAIERAYGPDDPGAAFALPLPHPGSARATAFAA